MFMEYGHTRLDKDKNGGVRDWLNMYSVHGGESRLIHLNGKESDTHTILSSAQIKECDHR
jgi:hypothetical protein